MKGFIEVTEQNIRGPKKPALVCLSNIAYILDVNDGTNIVYPGGGKDNFITVSESYEEVKQLIENAI